MLRQTPAVRTSNSRKIRVSPHDRSRTPANLAIVPAHLHATATAQHRRFFRPPIEPDHPRFRITENAAHRRFGPKTREAICIPKSPPSLRCSRHSSGMPKQTGFGNAKTLRNSQVSPAFPYLNLPTQFHVRPFFILLRSRLLKFCIAQASTDGFVCSARFPSQTL